MPTRQFVLGILLAASLTASGCCHQRNGRTAHRERAVIPASTQETSTQPAEDHRDANGFLKPKYWPRTVEQAVDLLVAELPPADKDEIKSTPKDELIMYHLGFGMGIRNSFGLWTENHELLRDCALHDPHCLAVWKEHPDAVLLLKPDYAEYMKEHPSTRPTVFIRIHPDDASMLIIEALWQRLQESPQ